MKIEVQGIVECHHKGLVHETIILIIIYKWPSAAANKALHVSKYT